MASADLWTDREHLERPRIAHGRVAAQALDQRAADACVHGRDEAEPQAREPRCQDRNRDHRPAQAALFAYSPIRSR